MIDNDSAIYETVCDSMQDDLTEVCRMISSAEALASYMKRDYCLVILDIQLTDMDGMELLRTMRQIKHTPILVLTKPLSPEEVVTLLHTGADTYLEKPLNVDVCVAQANTLIQRYITSDINHEHCKPVVHSPDFIISPRYRQAIINGIFLNLTRKEFDLLHYLADHAGQVFSCGQLYEQVWNDNSAVAVDDIVKSQIKRLRKKLSQLGKNYIQTEWGVGYKFVPSEH